MSERKWLTSNALFIEIMVWPNSNRNEDDLRFGQYLTIHYDGVPDEVFNIEDFEVVARMLTTHLEEVQR